MRMNTYNKVSRFTPRELMVLGRGLELNGRPTQLTRERAIAAAHYFDDFGVDHVVFSGGNSILDDGRIATGSTEAQIMAEIAMDEGLPEHVVSLEPDSTTTLQNFVNSQELLTHPEGIGVVSHSDHMPRALWLGKMVLPGLTMVPIEATLSTPSRRDYMTETVNFMITRALMFGVKPGNVEALIARERAMTTVATSPLLLKLVRANHTGVSS